MKWWGAFGIGGIITALAMAHLDRIGHERYKLFQSLPESLGYWVQIGLGLLLLWSALL